jgi:Transcription factor WhiB
MPRYDEIEWELANCRGIYTDLFFNVEEERSKTAYYYINAVRIVCGGCQIWEKCLGYAFANEEYGVWGGLTSLERSAFSKPEKYARQKAKAVEAMKKFGITEKRLQEIYEHSRNEFSVADKSTTD